MVFLEWRDEFKTGIPSVDYEHEQLFEVLNEVHRSLGAGDPAAVDEFMATLHDKIAAHFALEERVMRDLAYRRYDAHKAEHEQLLDDIRDLMEEHRAGVYENAADRLSERLERWFSVHFSTEDVRLHRAIGDVELGGPAE